jgi:hypothetical protein
MEENTRLKQVNATQGPIPGTTISNRKMTYGGNIKTFKAPFTAKTETKASNLEKHSPF